MTAAAIGGALTGLWFIGQKYYPDNADQCALSPKEGVFLSAQEWLDRYFAGENPAVGFPLALNGTAFRKEVWDILRGIPYGKTMTYGQIAALIAKRRGVDRFSGQAVGGAVGHNPISIVIPCHRVVGASGGLTGYAGGLERKSALLKLEGIKYV